MRNDKWEIRGKKDETDSRKEKKNLMVKITLEYAVSDFRNVSG